MRVNLHTHSTKSDGTLTPKEVINKLYENKVEICALTDHDTLDGLEEAQNTAEQLGILFINGIEIPTKINELDIDFITDRHTIHLLALNFDRGKLQKFFDDRLIAKKERIETLISQLKNDKYRLNYDSLVGISKRTSIAKELVNNKYAVSVQDAFNNIINTYYNRFIDNLEISEVVKIVHESNGKVIWAHPYDILFDVSKVRINEEKVAMICKRLSLFGIDGIEVYYEKFSDKQIEFFKLQQEKFCFITSCGTDYHAKPIDFPIFMEIDINLIKEVLR